MKKVLFSSILIIVFFSTANSIAQNASNRLSQNINGIVIDASSGSPLPYVSVGIPDLPEIGIETDSTGHFTLKNVPIGRHNIQATFIGYDHNIIREVLVTSAKEIYLQIPLKENGNELSEVVVYQMNNKNEPLNKMATTGAYMLSVEQANRYARGFDDPARLVSAFAGVSPSVSNNGISIHGNAPHLLQWRLEDVEIPNPNHFADVSTLGGGILSSLSSHVLGNSDFFTGAFPAEYGNAVSGVFDMKLRNGNYRKHENTFQFGIMGIDFASEGPISKKNKSSYIFNYRYSTIGLLKHLGSGMEGKMDYQDLNFKLNFPTKKAGTFSIWGTSLIDKFENDLEDDISKWETNWDKHKTAVDQYAAAGGLSHRYIFSNDAMLKTTFAGTFSKYNAWQNEHDSLLNPTPFAKWKTQYTNLIINSAFNRKFSSKFTNKTGLTYTKMFYDMDLKVAPHEGQVLDQISEGKGNTDLITAYNSSTIGITDNIDLNIGVHGQYLTLNDSWTIEPRAGIKWQASSKSSFALAYGMHSRMERLDAFFTKTPETGNKLVNKDLDFTKAHHIMLSYNYQLSEDMNIRFEPYFQYLYNVPVIADSSYSVLNRIDFYVENPLVNKGKGYNYGIDITFERYLKKGLYYMITASAFDSRYRGGDGKWHNTRYNRNFILNGLIGKEWMIGNNKQNILSVNLKLTLQGGERYSPIDEQATFADPDWNIKYDDNRTFSKQFSPMLLANYTVSYKMNMKKTSHEFAIKGLNATGYKEFYGHFYNFKTGKIQEERDATTLTNVSYKLEF